MGADEESPVAPSTLPDEVLEHIDDLDESQLRAVIDYAQKRMRFVHPDVTEQIENRNGEEIVRIEERTGYTEVVKRQPCAEGCAECPHGPFLYHVCEERSPDRPTSLHWTYLGRILE
ncbi:hypothetical protein [Halomarina litorea]|uniref:hypothetical protein n=1 Tax=Halomarina litorea TaxID=2961595 RepID=UPI0020C28666|nr:hypothetical protein [Halomarina sp. BCD28]